MKLNKVRGRITHAKQIKAGMTLYSSGTSGVEVQRIVTKPFPKYCRLTKSYDLSSFWIEVSCNYQPNTTRTRSLNDKGVHQQGGYINPYNRLFRTEAQANNWQVYLDVSGLRARSSRELEMEGFGEFCDYDYEYVEVDMHDHFH